MIRPRNQDPAATFADARPQPGDERFGLPETRFAKNTVGTSRKRRIRLAARAAAASRLGKHQELLQQHLRDVDHWDVARCRRLRASEERLELVQILQTLLDHRAATRLRPKPVRITSKISRNQGSVNNTSNATAVMMTSTN